MWMPELVEETCGNNVGRYKGGNMLFVPTRINRRCKRWAKNLPTLHSMVFDIIKTCLLAASFCYVSQRDWATRPASDPVRKMDKFKLLS
jgi:hypothetical protein